MRFQSTIARLGFRALVILLATGFSLLLFTISVPWFGFDFMPQLHESPELFNRGRLNQRVKSTRVSYVKHMDKLVSSIENGQLEKESLKILHKIESHYLGSEDTKTVGTLELLASEAVLAEKYDEGLSLYWRVYKIREKTLGPTHSDTLQTLQLLGETYHYKGNYKKAADFFKVLYKRRKTVLGLENVETMEALFLLGGSLWKADESPETVEKVLNYFRRAHKVYSRTSGAEEKTLVVLSNIGNCLIVLERFEEAIPVLWEIIKTTEKTPQSHFFERAENLLSFALNRLDRTEEARQLYKTTRRIKGKSGKGIPEYESIIHADGKFTLAVEDEISTALNLARVAHAQRNFKHALEILEKIQSEIGKDHPKAKEVFHGLMKAHGTLGNLIRAFEMSIEHFKAVQKQFYGESSDYNQKVILAWKISFNMYIAVAPLHPNEDEELFRSRIKEISENLVIALEEELELQLELEFIEHDQENPQLLKIIAIAASLAGKREMSLSAASKVLEILKNPRKSYPKPSIKEMEKIIMEIVFFHKMLDGEPICESAEKCEIPYHLYKSELGQV